MATERYKTLSKSKYKGVYPVLLNGKQIWWQAIKTSKGVIKIKHFKTEREAAIFYDKLCIEFGLQPVNILKPKL